MPAPGTLGGPGLPGRVRISESQLVSSAVLEQDRFGHFIKEAERSGDKLMEALAEKMEDKAQRYAPHRTGRLKASIQAIILNRGREVRVVSNVPYATVMEKGSRPHLIHGVKANFRWKGSRRFIWNNYRFGPIDDDAPEVTSDGRYLNWSKAHGATVRHPGTKPHLFFTRAFAETWQEARWIMRRVYV